MSATSARGRRRHTLVSRGFGALVVAAALGFVTAAGAGAADGTPDSQLLKTYQPVLVFHPNELFRPTKVQSFVEDSELERLVGPNPVLDTSWTVVDPDPEPGDLPPVTPGAFYRLDQTACEADAPLAGQSCYAAAWGEGSGGDAVYGRVVRTETRIVLQYWLFYYDNPLILPPTPFGTFWQSHEGDWEVVNVILGADETPLEAAYSQHCSGQRKAWSGVDKSPVDSTHPIAYVALGSHANFFSAPGPIPITCIPAGVPPLPFIVDQVVDGSGAGAVVGPPGSGADAATIHPIEGQSWSTFGGGWGESEYLFTPIAIPSPPAPFPVPANTAVPVGLAPASPALQSNWNPATVLGWPLVP